MVTLQEVRRKCQALAISAIDDIVAECFKDGGTEGALKAIAALLHGDVLPGPVIRLCYAFCHGKANP